MVNEWLSASFKKGSNSTPLKSGLLRLKQFEKVLDTLCNGRNIFAGPILVASGEPFDVQFIGKNISHSLYHIIDVMLSHLLIAKDVQI